MAGFPLHRLPFLPLKDVLDYMNLADFIRISLCSKKTCELLKAMGKSVTFDSLSESQMDSLNKLGTLYLLRLETYNNPRGSVGCFPENTVTTTITIASDKIELRVGSEYHHANRYLSCLYYFFSVERHDQASLYRGTNDTFEFDGITVPVYTNNKKTIRTYWEDQSVGLTFLVNYFKKFFNAQTIEYIIKGSKGPQFSQNLRMVVNGMAHQTISSCEINSANMDDDDYKLILDNVDPTHSFKQNSSQESRSNNFQHNISFKSEDLTLKPTNWFTFDNLLSIDCTHIDLSKTRFSNDDMCKYLELWMDGNFSKLKSLTVQLQENVNLNYIHTVLEKHLETLYASGIEQHSERYTIISGGDQIHIQLRETIIANIKSIGCHYWPQPETYFSFSIE